MKKMVSICLPCMNEVDNVIPIAEAITEEMKKLPQYDYEIIFSDNCSTDGTQDNLRILCARDKHVKAILNAKNFQGTSVKNALYSASGDCAITIPTDFQMPVSLIPIMLNEWEKGADVVAPVKVNSKENKMMLGVRRLYYKIAKSLSDHDTLPGFTGSGLYDKNFLKICKESHDQTIELRRIINNYGINVKTIKYVEEKRRSGKSKGNFKSLFNAGIFRIISHSNALPHYAIMFGIFLGIVSFFIAVYYLVMKLIYWESFSIGIAPLVVGVFFIGSVQLIFIGFIGEYIISISERQWKHNFPLVVEKERINFEEDSSTENKTKDKNV